jgi:FkbM family methyltransferase
VLAEDAEDETVLIRDTHQVLRFVWNHPGNKGQRGQALLQAVSFQARGRLLGRQSRVRIGDHSYIWASLHRPGSSKAVYGNPPDHPEMLVWQRRLGPGDLFVDVGANVGSYSILAGDLGAGVIALEPAPDTFALLAENVRLNGYPVTMLKAAAGAACGTARFTSGQDAVNRLAADGPAEIEMVTLDTVIGDRIVAGVKIDVEGFEIEVLRGCEQALAEQRIRLIQLEWNQASTDAVGTDRAPVAALLARHGYRLFRPDPAGSLVPVEAPGYGPDVFACPGPPDAHDNKCSSSIRE